MHCLSNHFTHFPYVTGTLPAVALVLNPRGGGSAVFKCMRALQAKFPENPAVCSMTPTPTGIYSQKLWGFISLVLEP